MKNCAACFKTITQSGKCPHCGYDPEQRVNSMGLPVGTILFHGQYQVGRVLGKPGGFGITYLALDINLNTFVAIKEFFPRHIVGRDSDKISLYPYAQEDQHIFNLSLIEFVREARILAQLNHPNIVRVRSYFEENSTAYIVMDYLEGQTLAEYLSKIQRMHESEAIQLISPIFDSLAYLHQRNFVHRDVKPQNIFITDQGNPILLDFGASRQVIQNRSNSLTSIMTPGYAPMEQYNRKGLQGPWTDVYSCAATIYHMLIGEPPPEAPARIVGEQLVDLKSRVFALSNPMITMIERGLIIEPENRPQSMKDFTNLYYLLSRHDVSNTNSNVTAYDQINRQQLQKAERKPVKQTTVAAIALVAVLVIAFMSWKFAQSDSSAQTSQIVQTNKVNDSGVNLPSSQTQPGVPVTSSKDVPNTNIIKMPVSSSSTAQNAVVRQTVLDFYNYIGSKKYLAAWEYLSPQWKQAAPYNQWVAGYADTVSTQVDSAEVIGQVSDNAKQATVRVYLTAKSRQGSRILTEKFSGEITLVRQGVFWALDESSVKKTESRYAN